MKFTLSWLKDHLETAADVRTIADALTHLGLEVEKVEDKAEALKPFTVARVVSCERHPAADKLSLCKVDTGEDVLQVVCGAPNVHAGMKGVFARVGTTIPATGLKLTKAKIRGVESNGMLCSAYEMGISEDRQGIIELPEDAPMGEPFTQVLGLDDPVVEVAVTPNRPDCLGVRGLARELAAAGVGKLKPDDIKPVRGRFSSPIGITLKFSNTPPACPLFAGRVVRGVKNGESPNWLKKRLAAIGLRPINALVDVTNYVANDRARPLHVYDAKKLKGAIGARMGRAGERFRALDGCDYAVDETMCVIADESGVLGLGGIMGGESSGSTASTVDVFIESALFEPAVIAATGRKLGVVSDARYRFERGVDPDFVLHGLELATRMILELCGGEPSELVVVGKAPSAREQVHFDPSMVARLAGLSVVSEQVATILATLGFRVEKGRGGLAVTPPSWRADIHGSADLVEEVARVTGLDKIPSVPLPRSASVTRPVLTARQRNVRVAKRALAARGLVEAVTYSFVGAGHATLFSGHNTPPVKLENPISSGLDAMRPSGLPALILAAQRNVNRGFSDCALFEVGPVFSNAAPDGQATVAAGIRRGNATPRHWRAGARAVDAFDVKSDVTAALEALGIAAEVLQPSSDTPAWYHPGQSGVLRLGPKTVLAQFGVIHPAVLDKMDAKGPLAGFEIFLDAIPLSKARTGRARPSLAASDLMSLERDFAFVVDAGVAAQDILRAARRADKEFVADVTVFDVFADESLGAGKKSVAIAVTIQPREKTLTDEEIEALSRRIVESVIQETKGTLRA